VLDGLKPHPERKDSGLPWLGEIPAHWTAVRIKRVLREMDRRSPDGSGTLLSLTRVRGLIRQSDMSAKATTAATLEGYKQYLPGEIVMNRMQAWSGMFGFGSEPGLVSPDYAVFRLLGGSDPAFLVHLLRSPSMVAQFAVESKGIGSGFNRLYTDKFGAISMPLPPPAEQAGIVRFLGAVDRKVNRFIRAKRRLIEVLTEQKQAIITHAVTKGLNPSAPLKPSGLDWLGDVPEHWNVARAGSVAEFISTKAHEQFVEDDGEHICVTARFVSTDGRSFRRCTKNFSPAQRGDVLMVMSDLPRGRALARAYFVNDDKSYAVNQRVCILRPKRVNPRYLAFATNRHPELLAQDDGFNQTHLPNAAFKIMRLALPPLTEQTQIVESLVRTTSAIDTTIDRTEREIDLIREYRTRLVADVVTGKVDVRAAAAAIPDEAQGPGTDQGAGGAHERCDDPASEDDAADGGDDLEPALEGSASEGEDEA